MDLNKVLGGILLSGGTAIGAGMLALPMQTAMGGFFPSLFMLSLCWVFMTIAALYMLEVCLMCTGEADLLTMAQKTLGPIGKGLMGLVYLSLLYALISAYLKGGASWFIHFFEDYFPLDSSDELGMIAIATIGGAFVCFGTKLVDLTNRWLSIGLFLAYGILIFWIAPHIKIELLTYSDTKSLIPVLPLMITAFGYSIVIPTLSSYLNRHTLSLVYVVIFGSLMSLAVYIAWEFVTLGTLPNDILSSTDTATSISKLLSSQIQNEFITRTAQFFSIFAILTSFLGVSMSLFHFLADGLKWKVNNKTRLPLWFLTFIPPMAIMASYPQGFSSILKFAGMIVALLLGILPATMVWFGRYHTRLTHGFRVPGGKGLILIVMVFFTFVIYQELCYCLG